MIVLNAVPEEVGDGRQEGGQLVIRPSRDFSSVAGTASLSRLGILPSSTTAESVEADGSVTSITRWMQGGESNDDWSGNPELTARTFINTEAAQLTVSAHVHDSVFGQYAERPGA